MSILPFLLLPALVYAIPVGIGALLLCRKAGPEACAILWPSWMAAILSWLALMFAFGGGKSLSNLLVEPLIVAGTTLLVSVICADLHKQGQLGDSRCRAASLGCSVGAALLVYWLVKALPE